jgi:hypothetical protein
MAMLLYVVTSGWLSVIRAPLHQQSSCVGSIGSVIEVMSSNLACMSTGHELVSNMCMATGSLACGRFCSVLQG